MSNHPLTAHVDVEVPIEDRRPYLQGEIVLIRLDQQDRRATVARTRDQGAGRQILTLEVKVQPLDLQFIGRPAAPSRRGDPWGD